VFVAYRALAMLFVKIGLCFEASRAANYKHMRHNLNCFRRVAKM